MRMIDSGGQLEDALPTLEPHDHLCLIYDTYDEWKSAIVPFFVEGLRLGQKCFYVADQHKAHEIVEYLAQAGTDSMAALKSGRLQVLDQAEAYTRGGVFDPDRMITVLKAETMLALEQGYPALRASGEMTWALRGYVGSDRLLEYEAKLNRDFFPHYPCVAICQYERRRFTPEILKGIIVTHPIIVHGRKVHRNPYFRVDQTADVAAVAADKELQLWLDALVRESEAASAYRVSQEKCQQACEILRLVAETDGCVVWAANQSGVIVACEGSGLKDLGLAAGQTAGRSVDEVFGRFPEIAGAARAGLSGDTRTSTVEIGEKLYHASISPLRRPDGGVCGAVGFFHGTRRPQV